MEITEEFRRRFYAKVAKDLSSGCHIWTGARLPKGYGQIKIPGTRRQIYAHRAAYEMAHGLLAKGRHVLHRCDNPRCVNPEHLFSGTAADNMADKAAKGRALPGEQNPHATLTEPEIRAIRQLAADGMTQAAIARRFGVSQPHIGRIVRGEQWGRVEPSATGD